MNLFRRPRFMSVTYALLALLMMTLATRSEANCFSLAPETVGQSQDMENCADMDAGTNHSSQSHYPDGNHRGMCHLGCPILLTMTSTNNHNAGLFSENYLRPLQPLMVGILDTPQTPPPRFA